VASQCGTISNAIESKRFLGINFLTEMQKKSFSVKEERLMLKGLSDNWD
jgi:hypothetical protein